LLRSVIAASMDSRIWAFIRFLADVTWPSPFFFAPRLSASPGIPLLHRGLCLGKRSFSCGGHWALWTIIAPVSSAWLLRSERSVSPCSFFFPFLISRHAHYLSQGFCVLRRGSLLSVDEGFLTLRHFSLPYFSLVIAPTFFFAPI